MSGGVDSAMCALLLRQSGYEVIGVTFRFLEDTSQIDEAKTLCKHLNIKHIVIDKREKFNEKVIDYFVSEYCIGRTPFPCTVCNIELKWKTIFNLADELGVEKVAMGHYADVVYENGFYFIKAGKDEDKDQSFFQWHLKQEELKRIVFPLANYTKKEVKTIARENGIEYLANKKESIGACFCQGDYRTFLRDRLNNDAKIFKKGNFVDEEGNVLGFHQGFSLFTVGQRRGFGIQTNKAMYVKELRPNTNEVVLTEHKNMFQNEFYISNYHITSPTLFSEDFDTITRIRYRKQNTLSRIKIVDENLIKIELKEPLDAIAPGQTAVFYRNGKVLGGGFIV